jgi:hypothetical protein
MMRRDVLPIPEGRSGRVIGWLLAVVALLGVASLALTVHFQLRYGPIGGDDLLAKAGFDSDSDVRAIEYCEDIPAFDLVDDPDAGAKTKPIRVKTYRLTRPKDDRLIDDVCACLRHMSRTRDRPQCWVPFSVVAVEDKAGSRKYIPLVKMWDDEIVYADVCDLYSPQLYRRLERITRDEIGAHEKAWKVRDR